MDVALEDLELSHEVKRVALCLRQRYAWALRERLRFEQSRNGVDITLEYWLFVACDLDERFEDPCRVGMEAHDLANPCAVLKVRPAASLQSRYEPPRKRSDELRVVAIASRPPSSRWQPTVAPQDPLPGSITCLVILPRKHLEILSPIDPESRGADYPLCDLQRHRSENNERLALELLLIQGGEKVPVDLGIGSSQGGEQTPWDPLEETRHVVMH